MVGLSLRSPHFFRGESSFSPERSRKSWGSWMDDPNPNWAFPPGFVNGLVFFGNIYRKPMVVFTAKLGLGFPAKFSTNSDE